MEFVLNNLQQMVRFNINLFSGAEKEVQQLETELRSLRACMKDACKRHRKDETFQDLERRIREVIYDVEDAIDSDIINLTATRKAKSFLRQNYTKVTIAELVRSLREEKVKPLIEEAKVFVASHSLLDEPDSSAAETRDIRQRRRQNHIVGFEDEATTLIENLLHKSNKLEVISVVGMPGLGKTTVAWKIFKDPRIEFEFHTRIWVNISEEVNIKNVLLAILRKFTESNLDMNVGELTEAVMGYLEKGKFLIVMDDVWTTDAWDCVKAFLPLSNKNGRVLITSRHKNVAYHANPMRKPHKLRFLTEDESWELLQFEVYGQLNAVDTQLVPLGTVIAKLCDGLPLSIIVIGGILLEKVSVAEGSAIFIRREWEDVSRSIKTYLMYADKNKRLENIISLSYAKLPYELRDCFLYLGVFPEDANISARRLSLLWMAEGLILEIPGRSFEEVAKDNLNDLINRNLVMVDKAKQNGDPKICRVHDSIRQFCKTEAGDKQNLFQEVRMSSRGVFEPRLEGTEILCRRLCIHSYVRDLLLKKQKVPRARPFLCFAKDSIILDNVDIPHVTDAFSVLRVLDAENIKFPKFPAKLMLLICLRLICLRHLTLSIANEQLKSLPDTLSNLGNLQTLIVDISSHTIEIKADIWKMMELRHLKSKASIILKNDAKGDGGDNLQTLSRLAPESCTETVFGKARNLITLGIKGDLSTLSDSRNLEKLVLLKKLKLVHDVYNANGGEQPWRQLPEPNRFPPKLKVLVLSGTYLGWEKMSTLGKLGSLEELKLKDNAFTGDSWEVVGGSFERLELLRIERADLISWTTSGVALPKLKSISLKNCDKLIGVPLELGKNLEFLYLERVTTSAVASAKRIEKEKYRHMKIREPVFRIEIAPADDANFQLLSPGA